MEPRVCWAQNGMNYFLINDVFFPPVAHQNEILYLFMFMYTSSIWAVICKHICDKQKVSCSLTSDGGCRQSTGLCRSEKCCRRNESCVLKTYQLKTNGQTRSLCASHLIVHRRLTIFEWRRQIRVAASTKSPSVSHVIILNVFIAFSHSCLIMFDTYVGLKNTQS